MHKYLNPKNYIRYFLNRFVGLASIVLQPVESCLAKKYGNEGIKKYPPVFLIGAPRCGSTLLYNVMFCLQRGKDVYFVNHKCSYGTGRL